MTIRLLHGDCRSILPTLADASVHCVVTSPPYMGLRDYGTGTWEGGDAACGHAFVPDAGATTARVGRTYQQGHVHRDCKCGARRVDRQIGLERTPDEYLATMVAVFREVRRVLRPDGVCWINCGDSYASSMTSDRRMYQPTRDTDRSGGVATQRDPQIPQRRTTGNGLKPKDLMMMPARLALALQADGWWLRSMLPWLKRSAMPESVTDRPASAVEYVFLLTKSPRYFFDADAVRRSSTDLAGTDRFKSGRNGVGERHATQGWAGGEVSLDKHREYHPAGRAMRNSDLFYDSLEPEPVAAPRMRHRRFREGAGYFRSPVAETTHARIDTPAPEPLGLICDADGEPLALDVNPAAFSAAHFATFPVKLVEPLVRAGTSERGCCAACGAPWRRVVERGGYVLSTNKVPAPNKQHGADFRATERAAGMTGNGFVPGRQRNDTTTGWAAGCACQAAVVPCTVLDPFAGAGTTLLVADRLQRDAIGIELNPDYVSMSESRAVDDAPLLAWGAVAEAAE